MTALEKSILTLTALDTPASREERVFAADGRASLIVTLVYLFAVLSVPLTAPVRILWLAVYPIAASTLCGMSFGRLFVRSLCILPFLTLFGIFNPLYDREMIEIAGVTMTRGWLTFISIIVRGLFTFQALLIFVQGEGFTGMCKAMERLKVPAVMTTQLLMVYRYLMVLLTEALEMKRAREARGFGRKSFTLREWGRFMGQLFIRTVERSERIHRAMLARGFTGSMPHYQSGGGWKISDTVWTAAWTAVILAVRLI